MLAEENPGDSITVTISDSPTTDLQPDLADPWSDKVMIAQMISTLPERRGRALELARDALADLDAVDLARYPGRPLGETASEYADVLARARAEYNRLLAAG